MSVGARSPRDSAEVVIVGRGWFSMVSTEFPARDRPAGVSRIVRLGVRSADAVTWGDYTEEFHEHRFNARICIRRTNCR